GGATEILTGELARGLADLTSPALAQTMQSIYHNPPAIDDAALARNPFRIFTSLLRLELIENRALRERAEAILARRKIFPPRCLALIAQYEAEGEF
ncbi:DUF1338 family protein, partial [Mycobacterium tuberculosis]|nr:DUF1338 family protein [Mycobacterium tuberculosis]